MGKGSGNCDRPSLPIYGLSDLHLGPGVGKGHYSSNWVDHQAQLRKNWDKRIEDDAVVLLPGDFSWHRDPEDLRYDYLWIDERPGCAKILSPGNHDYGIWNSEREANDFLEQFQTQTALMDNAIRIPNPLDPDGAGLVIAGAQGSQSPGDYYFNTNAGASSVGKENESVRYLGELVALDQALRHAKELQKSGDELIVMIHYPPFADMKHETIFSQMIERAGASLCIYGHLHQKDQFRKSLQGRHNGTEYRFVGSDFLRFEPTKLAEWTKDGLEVAPLEVEGPRDWPESKKASSNSSSQSTPQPARRQSTGEILVCLECNNTIYDNQNYHWSPKGALHDDGKGKYDYGTLKTCGYKKNAFNPNQSSASNFVPASNGSAPKGHSSSQPKPAQSTDQQRLVQTDSTASRKCEDCNSPIEKGEIFHNTSTGSVHGPGAYGQHNTCWFRTKNQSHTPAKESASKNKSIGDCLVCEQPVGPGPNKNWCKKDGNIICTDCARQLQAAS
jgi:predicted phosphohydrolase